MNGSAKFSADGILATICISSRYYLSFEMIFVLDVFPFPMISWFFQLCNCSTVVAKQHNGRLFYLHDTKIC